MVFTNDVIVARLTLMCMKLFIFLIRYTLITTWS